MAPTLLEEWMPAFLAQLAAPRAQLVRATGSDGHRQLYVIDADRESFAAFAEIGSGWTVRQGGPVALWDDIERTLTAWQDAERPGIGTVRLRVTPPARTRTGSATGPHCVGNTGSADHGPQTRRRAPPWWRGPSSYMG
ncbi:hypothetical protein [Streptomyces rapamycinicus]|nr:hypothetical protein [Streptomyces rapamycinicus]MBB4785076.1 hypothetical protein [Streptomyces rapamycinicus]